VVEAGIDGLLVEFLDDTGLGEALILLLRNPAWARALGRRGYEKMMARYTWAEIARRFRGVFECTLKRKSAVR
jgi:glycosyltransferase involved in cell wall biosynthesis